MILEVVQVELVGDAWWEKLLPILAMVVSFGTLGWTMHTRYRDQARLKVRATSFTLLGETSWGTNPDAQEWHIAVDVTNEGLVGSTSVHSVKFKLPNGSHLQTFESYRVPVKLPKQLGPGESFMYVFNVQEVAAQLIRHGYEPAQLTPVAVSGHGPATGKWTKAGLGILEDAVSAKRAAEATAG